MIYYTTCLCCCGQVTIARLHHAAKYLLISSGFIGYVRSTAIGPRPKSNTEDSLVTFSEVNIIALIMSQTVQFRDLL